MQTKTISLDGVQYDLDRFSHAVQHIVMIHNKFTLDLQEAQLEVMKNQAAIKHVSDQLTEQIKKELMEEPQAAPIQ